jgi:prevent-host-death family protein
MAEVGTFEAKNKLSELLDRAERGEETIITRRGKPIAKIVPVPPPRDVEKAKDVARQIRELAKTLNFTREDFADALRRRREGLK